MGAVVRMLHGAAHLYLSTAYDGAPETALGQTDSLVGWCAWSLDSGHDDLGDHHCLGWLCVGVAGTRAAAASGGLCHVLDPTQGLPVWRCCFFVQQMVLSQVAVLLLNLESTLLLCDINQLINRLVPPKEVPPNSCLNIERCSRQSVWNQDVPVLQVS